MVVLLFYEMRTYHILYRCLGGTSYSPLDPWHVYDPRYRDVGLSFADRVSVWIADDDSHPTTRPRYEVRLVTLPDWLSAEEWIQDRVKWRWTWGFGVDPTWPESWQRFVAALSGHPANRLAVVQLLRVAEPKGDVRRSLRAQLLTWLKTPVEQRRFDTPFSPKQWGCLTNRWIARRAHQQDQALYYQSHAATDTGPRWNHKGRRR